MSYLTKAARKVVTKMQVSSYVKKMNSNTKEVPVISLFEFVMGCDEKAKDAVMAYGVDGKDAAMACHDSMYNDMFDEDKKEYWEKMGVVFTNDGYKCLSPPQIFFGEDTTSFVERIVRYRDACAEALARGDDEQPDDIKFEMEYDEAVRRIKLLGFIMDREVKYFTLNKITYYGINN